jgi:hypothetical protein
MEAAIRRITWWAMLTDELNQLCRRPALGLVVVAGGLLLGLLIGVLFVHGSDSSKAANRTTSAPIASWQPRINPHATQASTRRSRARAVLAPATAGTNGANSMPVPQRGKLDAAMSSGVGRVRQLGGEAAAAVWIGGDAQPLLSGPTRVLHRMWSTSKAVVTIAALEATNDTPDHVLGSAMTDAIRRSDNCAIRRVIVGLQDRVNKGVAGAVEAFERVLTMAGVGLQRSPQSGSVEQACVRYLHTHQGGLPGSDLGVAPLFGTAEWSQHDAISFAHSLSEGVYGASGAYLLRLMGLPKEPPLEEPSPPSAPLPGWGAGAAFPASWKPAWKAGWGGSQDDPPHYLATQIVVLHLGATPVAVTAIFVPTTEPPNDNPGITRAPEALEFMFRAVRYGLEEEHVGGVQ